VRRFNPDGGIPPRRTRLVRALRTKCRICRTANPEFGFACTALQRQRLTTRRFADVRLAAARDPLGERSSGITTLANKSTPSASASEPRIAKEIRQQIFCIHE
jgi:hypothetical protein